MDRFFRGQVDKYTWVDLGSSYLPGEVIAAFLAAQLEHAREITDRRLKLWNNYHDAFSHLETSGRVSRPTIPKDCQHNAHMYYLLLENLEVRTNFIDKMKQAGIVCVFHYVPLHTAPYGLTHSRAAGDLSITEDISKRIVRLPLWIGLEGDQQRHVIQSVTEILSQ